MMDRWQWAISDQAATANFVAELLANFGSGQSEAGSFHLVAGEVVKSGNKSWKYFNLF